MLSSVTPASSHDGIDHRGGKVADAAEGLPERGLLEKKLAQLRRGFENCLIVVHASHHTDREEGDVVLHPVGAGRLQ